MLFSNTDRPTRYRFRAVACDWSGWRVVSVPPLYYVSQPPESIRTGIATSSADIYQVGLLMYRALNGDHFFTSQVPPTPPLLRAQISAGKFPDRKRFMPHVPSRLRTLVRKALHINPTNRFQSATDMADALSRVKLGLDWSVEPLPLGGFRWRALKPGQCDLVVELADYGGTWTVETFSERKGLPRRAKGKNENWRTGLNLNDAYSHLEDVFGQLLQ